jgi:hypothetical protein
MWVQRFIMLALAAAVVLACGGKSIKRTGGEAGAGSECADGRVECDGTCSNLENDQFNCGACGIRCASGQSCTGGRCSTACPPEMVPCSGLCVDVRYNPDHCGGCNVGCADGFECSNGVCISRCPAGQCGGICVDLGYDPNNCGACGFVCSPGQNCASGRCFNACMGPICNGECVDLSSDPRHCGGCNVQCPPDSYCSGGFCQPACPPEYRFCSGVCVDWRFDSRNCGGCGALCPGGTECVNGACVDACPTRTYCNGVCTDVSNDPRNCGSCNFACMSGRCFGGMCAIGTCGDGVVQPGEEGEPPPGPLMLTPLDPATCRWDLSRIDQWYCHGGCGNWGGGEDCDELDAHAFCKLKMDNPRSEALSFTITRARAEPGVCCPPPSYAPGALGCTSLGVLSSRGVSVNVSVHPSSILSTHHDGRVITGLVCSDP